MDLQDLNAKRHERRRAAAAIDRRGEVRPLTASPKEVAVLMGLGMTMVTKLVGEGVLRSVKVGRRRLILLDSVDEVLGRTQGTA